MKKIHRPKWKQFERLVASIETAALQRQAVITSPDRLPDITTGALREVDASIRAMLGTVPILITIECRLRSRPADTTWIEQLVTKRQQVGASRTVAVSGSGFTDAAVKVAAQHGIEVRTLTPADSEEVTTWFDGPTVVHLARSIDSLDAAFALVDGSVGRPGASEPCLSHPLVHDPFPPALFVEFLKLGRPEALVGVPRDGKPKTFTFEFNGDDRDLVPVPLGIARPEHSVLSYLRAGKWVDVKSIRLVITLSYASSQSQIGRGEHHKYKSQTQSAVRHSSFQGELLGMPVRFEHHSMDGMEPRATATFPSGFQLQSRKQQPQIVRRLELDELIDQDLCFSPIRVSFTDGTFADGLLLSFSPSLRTAESEVGRLLQEHFFFVEKTFVPDLAKLLSTKESVKQWPLNAPFIATIAKRDVHQVVLLRLNDA